MYRCSGCGSDIDDGFDRCWNCNSTVLGTSMGDVEYAPPTNAQATFRVFRDGSSAWESVYSTAAMFASALGRERVISIASAIEQNEAVVTVWFWSDRPVTNDRIREYERSRERELIILDPG